MLTYPSSGKGCEANPQLAFQYVKIASDKGFAPAKMNLANLYTEGLVVKQDIETAKILYREVLKSNAGGLESTKEQAQKLLDELLLKHSKTGY
jgi:TPR repeat protein